jgi:hypothetical protein
MKKRDIIQFIKETIAKRRKKFYGQHDYYGNNVGGRNSISGMPGVWEEENLKEYTNMGQDGIYPKKEKPGDMFQQQAAEELMPNAMASRNDKAFQVRLKQHADWTEQSSTNNTFVHVQYNKGESNNSDDTYFIHQTQHFNSNYDDFRNPKFTELYLVKNKGKENEEYLGTYIVDTKAYIQDLQDLRKMGIIKGDTVSENKELKDNEKYEPGKEFYYQGTKYKVIKNDGYVLTLKSLESGNELKLNWGQIQDIPKNENTMKKIKEADVGGKEKAAIEAEKKALLLKKQAIDDKLANINKGDDSVVEAQIEEEPNEMPTNDMGKDNWQDDEGRFAKSQLKKAAEYSIKLSQMMGDMTQLPAWVQSKITRASDYISMVYHYLDYEASRGQDDLMENMDKHRNRTKLMEGAWKDINPMFDSGKTDDEIVQHYVTKGVAPENVSKLPGLVAKLRGHWNDLQKMKTDINILDQEADGLKQSSQPAVSGMEGGEEGMEEEKQLASGLFNETK